jgi:hypothetical protein
MGGILGLIILVLDIVAIVDCVKSSLETKMKALWVVLVIVLPLIGMILYFVMGKKKA